jgi:endonuclease YncB( thermonuclease family)
MFDRRPAVAVAVVASLIWTGVSAPVAAQTTSFVARVVSVADGDTIKVRDARSGDLTVRVEGIDCPETGQPFGGVARRFTRVAVFDQVVTIRPVTRDRYGRIVARVIHDGKDLSVELLTNGLAWHFTEFSHDQLLAAAEREARVAKRGLWSVEKPVPPWTWRREARSSINRPVAPDRVSGPFRGNTSSHVFHAESCRNAHCKNCTATFETAEAALAAGYRPAGDCLH